LKKRNNCVIIIKEVLGYITLQERMMGAKKREALEQFNRDNILTAAAELFSAKGVDKTTMDDIAAYADYSKSTIYVYFQSKEDIYNSVLERRYSELVSDAAGLELESGDVRGAYDKLCACLVEFENLYPSYFASIMGETKTTNSRKTSGGSPTANQEIREVFKSILEYGIKNKTFKGRQDIEKTSLYMWTTIGGAILYSSKNRKYLEEKVGIARDEYLGFCFDRLYRSLC
jgi:AcrR family transcriptional regulator